MGDEPDANIVAGGTSEPAWQAAQSVIASRISEQGEGPKSARLREAITAAIVSGDLHAGDQLPPEPQIAAATGISLGMVRHALSQLAMHGFVSRQHGRGTFVSADADFFTERWHFRFLDRATGTPVVPNVVLLERRLARPEPRWGKALGTNENYINILRLGLFPNGQRFLSELVLPYEPFAQLLEVPASDIETRGIRFILADTYQTPIVQSRSVAKLCEATDFQSEMLKQAPGALLMRFDFTGEGFDDAAVFLLSLWLPRIDYDLDLRRRHSGA